MVKKPGGAGAYYREKNRKQDFCIGSLKEKTLDEILADSVKRENVFEHAVMQCKGCSNPCEVEREVRVFQQEFGISQNEISAAFRLDDNRKIGVALIDYDGWHEIERSRDGSCLCWSNAIRSNLFIPVQFGKRIAVSFRKLTEESAVKILLNGNECFTDQGTDMHRTVFFEMTESSKEAYITLTFLIEKLYTPNELYGSMDRRLLGVGVESVFYI